MGMVGANDIQTEYFAKQIAVKPDYTLSVSPTSVREDADPTNIAVKVSSLTILVLRYQRKYACSLAARQPIRRGSRLVSAWPPHAHDSEGSEGGDGNDPIHPR